MARRKQGRKLRDVELQANQKLYRVPLRVVDKTEHSNRPTFTYVIDVEEPCRVHVEDKDINEVMKKAVQVIEDQLAIEWKDVLHVSIGMSEDDITDGFSNAEADQSHGFTLKWKREQIGRRGDEAVHRKRKRGKGSFGVHANEPHIWQGELEVGKDGYGADEILYAVIDDTEENRNALGHIGLMLDTLQKRLNAVLKPEAIVQTLADVRAKIPLLLADPAPPKKATKKKAAAKVNKRVAKKKAKRKGRRG